jgi:hypothetical protein
MEAHIQVYLEFAKAFLKWILLDNEQKEKGKVPRMMYSEYLPCPG